jgi:hypothetical protein
LQGLEGAQVARPGWYNDEIDPTLARWHDGAGWTDFAILKDEWEERGEEPPPPEVLFAPRGPARQSQVRMLVGAAAVVAVLAIGGVALARDDSGGGSDGTRDDGKVQVGDEVDDRAGTGGTIADAVTEATSDVTSISSPDPGAEGSGAPSGGTKGAPKGTATTKASSTVKRTETVTNSHTNPTVQSQAGGGDKTSVGNTTNTTIKSTLDPSVTSTSQAPAEDPPPDGGDTTTSTVP